MKEFDLNDAWKNSDKQAEEYYSQIKSEVMELAQKKSESILDNLKRAIIWEWIATFIIVIITLILCRDNPNFWRGVIGCVVLLIITAVPYFRLWSELKRTPTQDMVTCIQSYIKILNSFIQRIKHFFLFMLPVGFFVGLYIVMEDGATFDIAKIQWDKLAFYFVFAAGLISTLFWFLNKYYMPNLYGKTKNEFQDILESLKEK